LQLEFSETVAPLGRRSSITLQVRFSGVGCKAESRGFLVLPEEKRGGLRGV